MSIEEVKITLLHCGKTNRCEGCPCNGEGMRCIHKALLDALDAILELEKKVDNMAKLDTPKHVVIQNRMAVRIPRCPACGNVIIKWGAKYCAECGQAVKWE